MHEYIEASHSLAYKAASDYSIHHAGYEDCPSGYHYGPRICPYHIIHFVTAGRGTLFIDGEAFALKKGDAFYIPQDKIASYQASETDPWSYAWIGFLGTKTQELIGQDRQSPEASFVYRGLDVAKYFSLIREASLLTENNQRNYFLANSILYRILAELYNDQVLSSRQTNTLAEEARYLIEMRCCENLKVTDIASLLGIHPNYLYQVFKAEYGVSPKQYLTTRKLEKACSLLKGTSLPISLISDTLSFPDQMSFSKAFRKAYLESPSDYRQRTMAAEAQKPKETLEDYVSYV